MPPILILGASTRAAAHSALRAGLNPTCADLFGDRDLAALCPARIVPRAEYPSGLAHCAEAVPRSPWFYTGALENYPDLIEQLSRDRPLWGNGAGALRGVRDPLAVEQMLRLAGLPTPSVRVDSDGLPRDGTWLVKPLASAGGHGIHPLEPASSALAGRVYYQERIAGLSLSATFIGLRADARLVGVTRQWTGRPGAPFAYVGSIGPWPVSIATRERLETLGRVLAGSWGLVGLFGVDFILRDEIPWPVEVNPRYTASVEVLELALGRALLAETRNVLEGSDESNSSRREPAPDRRHRFVAKLIVHASAPCRFPDEIVWQPGEFRPFVVPRIADVPQPGTCFEAGEPVLTLFATGPSASSCHARLILERARWHRFLRAENQGKQRSFTTEHAEVTEKRGRGARD